MELELAITSYQRLSPTVTTSRRFSTEHRYSLGRSPECDWHLPDPDRIVSSQHGEIFFRNGQYWVQDCSTNGLYVNGSGEPLGKGNESPIDDGDTIALGDYQFRVSVVGSAEPEPAAPQDSTETRVTGAPSDSPAATPTPAPAGIEAVAAGETGGGNPTLASGLGEQALADTHVDVPDVAIPQDWQWGSKGQPGSGQTAGPAATADSQLGTLFRALGMPQLAEEPVSAEFLNNLGELTRMLLDQLMELLRARAQQKQKLRVQQTLFQRRENNPLKFSATPEDALDALLVRRHGAYLGPANAIQEAFADIRAHEQALMSGVESVVSELLGTEAADSAVSSRWSVLSKARAYDDLVAQRRQQREEFGDSERMLHSSTFTETYEAAARDYKEEQYR